MSGTTVKTLESWKNGTQQVLDASVNHKAYLPGAIALIVVSVALLALLAYGLYRLYDFMGPGAPLGFPVAAILPLGIGGLLGSIPGIMGIYMVRQTIRNRDPETAPEDKVHSNL